MRRRATHDLQLHSLVSDADGSESKIDADRRYVVLGEGVVRESKQHLVLADTRVTDQQYLRKGVWGFVQRSRASHGAGGHSLSVSCYDGLLEDPGEGIWLLLLLLQSPTYLEELVVLLLLVHLAVRSAYAQRKCLMLSRSKKLRLVASKETRPRGKFHLIFNPKLTLKHWLSKSGAARRNTKCTRVLFFVCME